MHSGKFLSSKATGSGSVRCIMGNDRRLFQPEIQVLEAYFLLEMVLGGTFGQKLGLRS